MTTPPSAGDHVLCVPPSADSDQCDRGSHHTGRRQLRRKVIFCSLFFDRHRHNPGHRKGNSSDKLQSQIGV